MMLSLKSGPSNHRPLVGLRLLLIEDDEDSREMLSELLQMYGAQTFTAASTSAGLRVLQRESVDVIVSDIGLPDEDGYEFLRKFRAMAPATGSRTPAIALTGFGQPEDRELALAAGYAGFLTKPVDVDRLLEIIARLGPPEQVRIQRVARNFS